MKKSVLLFAAFVSLTAFGIARAQPAANAASQTLTRPRTVTQAAQTQPTPTPQTLPRQSTQTPAAEPSPVVTQSAPPITSTLPPAQSTPNTPPSVVPSISSFPALQPIAPLAPNRARTRILEAQRLLQTRLSPTAFSPSINLVTIAALDPNTSQIHLLTLPKQTLLTRGAETTLVSSLGASLRLRIVRPNYVNTSVIVSDFMGRQLTPLVVQYPIEKGGVYREMAYYTSAHPALMSPELVKSGQAYVRTMIDAAARRLKDKGFAITPQLIDIAERLCVVEHVDHGRFRNESHPAIYEDVYALYALNELDTYRYSVSVAGAGGMVQMIPWTYQMLRQKYPSVGLNPDFVLGMRNHGNALEAMLLYIQFTWNNLMTDPNVAAAYNSGLATQAELIAAGYNSNPARLGSYINRGGTAWRTLIPRETQIYLQIYKSFQSFVPLKTRS
ncbi:MAG TPA: hypothetical protein VNA19_11475 [Pyrinomonadaceae bacterium]|nr:hypothetical protein [Pyrinomonadaceae bacterium]